MWACEDEFKVLAAVERLMGRRVRRLALVRLSPQGAEVRGEVLRSGRGVPFLLRLPPEDLEAARADLPLPGNEILVPFLRHGLSLRASLSGLGKFFGWGALSRFDLRGDLFPPSLRRDLESLYGGRLAAVAYERREEPLPLLLED